MEEKTNKIAEPEVTYETKVAIQPNFSAIPVMSEEKVEDDDWGVPGLPLQEDAILQAIENQQGNNSISSEQARKTTHQHIQRWRTSK